METFLRLVSRTRFLACAIAAMFAVSSCEKDDGSSHSNSDAINFKTTITTRATDTAFESADEISVTAYDASGGIYAQDVKYTFDGTIFSSTDPIKYDIKDDELNNELSFRALYPYTSLSEDLEVSFSVLQDQSEGTNYTMSDLMSSYAEPTSEETPSLVFDHLMSKVVLNVTYDGITATSQSASLNAMLDVEYDLANYSSTTTGESKAITMARNGVNSYKAIVAPQNIAANSDLITISINGDSYYTISYETISKLVGGKQYTINVTISETDVTYDNPMINNWEEGDLNPAMEIYSAEELALIGTSDEYPLNGKYLLKRDINLLASDWTAIGTEEKPFTGSFDGGGYTISNLSINTEEHHQGLFGYVEGGSISNLIVDSSQVKGSQYVGAICGSLISGSISCCGVINGSVEGYGSVGGVTGFAEYSTITTCYNTGSVCGYHNVSGIIGSNNTTSLTACYNTGVVSGNQCANSICNIETNTISCYYIAGTIYDCGTRVLTLADLNDGVSEMNSASGSEYFTANEDGILPSLFNERVSFEDKIYVEDMDISSVDELKTFRDLVNSNWSPATATLTADLDLKGEEWTPIQCYRGLFDGGEHTISNLTINSSDGQQGLFGSVYRGSISNLIIDNPQVKGDYQVGAICGCLTAGTISNCSVTNGVVEAAINNVGGLAGLISTSTITACYNTSNVSSVSSNNSVGGIAGENRFSSIIACYNTGDVSGADTEIAGGSIGGIVGFAYGRNNMHSITACYNTGAITGSGENVGSVVGENDGSIITACYFIDQEGDDATIGVGNRTSSLYDYMTLTSVSELNNVVSTMNDAAGSTFYTVGDPADTHLPSLFSENLEY